MKLKGSEIFVQVLLEQGVDTLFGYPGGAVLDLYDALYDHQQEIRHILTSHEQGAAHAADGYARATGKTGVVLATSGPGATNLTTGIAAAFMDSVPMVAITGNVSRPLIGKDSFQEVYIAGITLPITKHNYIVQDASELAPILRQAFYYAQEGRKGPVLVDIPRDVMQQTAEYEKPEPVPDEMPVVPPLSDLKLAAEMIDHAKRPLLYCGGGVVSSEAEQVLVELMHKAGIPAVWTMMAMGAIDTGDPLNLGLVGMHGTETANRAVAEADLLIAVGARFSDRVALKFDTFAKNAKKLQIDVDPSEINKNVFVDHRVIGDAKQVLEALLPKVHKKEHKLWKRQIDLHRAQEIRPEPEQFPPRQILSIISALAGPQAIYTTDVGQHQIWAVQYVEHARPRQFLTSGGLGAMGYGYGAAIGAKCAFPDRTVVHITGDGSFHMNMIEAATAVSYGLPIITVIMNNQSLGMVHQQQELFYKGRYSATELDRKTDYVKVAEGFGARGYRCTNAESFRETFAEALTSQVPVWIECPIGRDLNVLPMIPAGGTIDDIIQEENASAMGKEIKK